MACGWCVAQTLLLARGPTSYHHLPATASSGKCFINTFTKIHELTTVLQKKKNLRDPHLLCWRLKLSLQPSLVADSSPHHGSLLMVNCSWLKTQDTRIIKTESNIACLVSICSRAICACTPLRNDESSTSSSVNFSHQFVFMWRNTSVLMKLFPSRSNF